MENNVAIASRIPISLRLPAEMAKEIDAYAVKAGMRKTDAFLHFLRIGIESEHKGQEAERLSAMENGIDEILSIVKGLANTPASNTLEYAKEAASTVARQFPAIEKMYLFGSIARGDARADSDIDLRLLLDRSQKFNLHDLEHFCKGIEQKTGREVDVITAETVKNKSLASAIERDKVLIYERKEH